MQQANGGRRLSQSAVQQPAFRRSAVVLDEPSQVQQLQQQPLAVQPGPNKPAASFEEAVAGSGLLLPAVAPGDTGNAFTTAQPFQLLSWYPRRARSG